MNLKKIIAELKRRNVFKVATAYAITGWLIIQIVVSIEEPLSLPNWFDTITILLVLIGFPIALIIAWAFELTPEGLKKTDEVESEVSETINTGKKLNRIIIGVLLVLIAFLVFDRYVYEGSSPENTNPSIAVLPFADLSPNNDQKYFSDGLSVELVTVLTKEKQLKVIDPTSSFKFREKDNDLKKVGVALDVAHVLEGSVRKSGNQIRITTRLVHVSDGINVWTETYDRTYNANNIFAIQDEISKKVLEILKVKLAINDVDTNKTTPLTTNTLAYENYLKANQLLINRNPKEIEAAIKLYENAISLDENFAEVYAKLAESYWHLINYGSINRDEALEEMRQNIDQALLLKSNLAIAYAALGHYYKEKEPQIPIHDIDVNYKKSIEKAKNLAPNNAQILMWYANSLMFENPKCLETYLKAFKIDPLNPVLINNIAVNYTYNNNFEKAEEFARKNIEANPNFITGKVTLIRVLTSAPSSKLGEGFIEAHNANKKFPENLDILSFLHLLSIELELFDFANTVEKNIIKLYPENPRIIENRIIGILMRREFEKGITLIDDITKKFNQRIGTNARLRSDMFKYVYFKDKNFITYIKKYHPIFLSDTLTNLNRDLDILPNLIVEFKKGNVKKEVIDRLTNIYTNGIAVNFEYKGDITKENLQTLGNLSKSAALNGDAKMFSKITYEKYFVRREKFTKSYEFNTDPLYDEIRNSKEVLEVLKLIEEDKTMMRNKAIATLQKEGGWKD